MWTEGAKEVPDEDAEAVVPETTSDEAAEPSVTPKEIDTEDDEATEEEAVIEEVSDDKPAEEAKPPKMKTVKTEEWIQANPQPPIW